MRPESGNDDALPITRSLIRSPCRRGSQASFQRRYHIARSNRLSLTARSISLTTTTTSVGVTFSAVTDSQGRFLIDNVPLGVYEADTELPMDAAPLQIDLIKSWCAERNLFLK